MRRRALLVAIVFAIGLLWQPFLYPAGKAALLLLDIYSPILLGSNVAALVTPEPRERESRESLGGVEMRVSWWRPGWGDRHPGVMLVNGATPVGNDNSATRLLGRALARAGYLVMLPEFPFLVEGRLDPDAPRVVDAAFGALRALPETEGRPTGAFGASVGGGILLVAAGSERNVTRADHVTVLGAYFDMDTYVASVATRSQGMPPAGVTPWEPSAEAAERIPPAVLATMTDEQDRARVRAALAAPSYEQALQRLAELSPRGRAVFDRLSPSTVWGSVVPPVFWIHDPDDSFEPLSEAYAARDAARQGRMVLVVPRLVQHAEPAGGVKGRDLLFVVGELLALLGFTLEVLRLAG